jgi:hypothetical protein
MYYITVCHYILLYMSIDVSGSRKRPPMKVDLFQGERSVTIMIFSLTYCGGTGPVSSCTLS